MNSIRSFIVLLIAVLSISEIMTACAGPNAAQCKQERTLDLNACKPVIYQKPPSAECCHRIRVSHAECFCPLMTPKLVKLLNVTKVIGIIEGCGRRVPRHFKCGSITR
ncbi:uncharacterized protein LOC126653888 [Mercurialis annua]|uniref:uncharacterized protein LOC126653888 n=1 Tax=Mercurialis annua TaxID=3986 RepID=UPI00215E3BD6|nr:uncharacterized protein LOC126653888 [Mercurialis annua]